MFLGAASEDGTGNLFIEHNGQNGDHCALDKVQGSYSQQHKGADSFDTVIDGGAHADDGVQGDSVKLREFGQQVDCVEETAEDGQYQGAHKAAPQGAGLRLLGVVEDHCRQNQRTTHSKVGKVTYKGGGSTLQQQLQKNFDDLAEDSGGGSILF